jgi:hypothetical protein
MPVRDWLDDEDDAQGAAIAQRMEQMDPSEKMRQARLRLGELLVASQQLGDALVRAGLSPGLCRDPNARLSELDRQAPSITLDALLTRLTQFAAEIGPTLLTGDGGALDDFEGQVRDLGDVVRPLRAMAQRERLKSRASRDRDALWQALSDVRVGITLDRLNRVLRELDALAPHLRPLSAAQWQALEATLAAEAAGANALTAPPKRGRPSGTLAGSGAAVPSTHAGALDAPPTVPAGYASIADEVPSDPDAPTFLAGGWLPDAHPNAPSVPMEPYAAPFRRTAAPLWLGQRPRKWGLVLATALLLLAGTATLTLFAQPALFGFAATATPTLTSAQETRAAGQLAHMPTSTVTPRSPTHAPATATPSGPARLSASPSSLTLPCDGSSASLTLTNKGGRTANWTASAPFVAGVTPSSGTLQPGESVELAVASYGATHGTLTIRWSGGSIRVRFSVKCSG